jgi:hypothetical protein
MKMGVVAAANIKTSTITKALSGKETKRLQSIIGSSVAE